jgi:hypothetical protein
MKELESKNLHGASPKNAIDKGDKNVKDNEKSRSYSGSQINDYSLASD